MNRLIKLLQLFSRVRSYRSLTRENNVKNSGFSCEQSELENPTAKILYFITFRSPYMEHFHSVIFGILSFTVLFSLVFNMYDSGITGYAIKSLHTPELVSAPAAWVERRYVCDLYNRDDCINCCEAVRKFTKGPAVLMDYESCIAKMPKRKTEDAAHVWEDCIRIASGLKPKYNLFEVVEEPTTPEPPIEMPYAPEFPAAPPVSAPPEQVLQPSLPPPEQLSSPPLIEQPAAQPPAEQPQPLPVTSQPQLQVQQPAALAPYKICSLLRKKPERPLVFMPFHPLMVASVIC